MLAQGTYASVSLAALTTKRVDRFDCLAAALDEINEVWVRLVLRTRDKASADGFGRLFPWIGLSGPAYTCGFHGLHNTGELLGIWPTLIERERVEPGVRIEIIEA